VTQRISWYLQLHMETRKPVNLCWILLLATVAAHASNPAGSDRLALSIRHAQSILETYLETTGVPAPQIAVGMDGEILWSEAYGVADRSSGKAASRETQFRIASISKILSGTLAAKLADEGLLHLDPPIGTYVDNIPKAWSDMTARMLAQHTSGIPHNADVQDALDPTFYPTTRAALSRFKDRPLLHAPGQDEH